MSNFYGAVFFDMDGLFVDSEPLWLISETELMVKHGYTWTNADQNHCLGGPLSRVGEYMFEKTGRKKSPSFFTNEVVSLMSEKLSIGAPIMPGAWSLLKDLEKNSVTTALVSVITGIPVRADVAMTGEITLRGEVLPIGGLKEKLLAAHRGGIKLVLIPEENVKDLTDIPDNVKNGIEIRPVRWIDQVLELALEKMPMPLPELTAEDIAKAAEASKAAAISSGEILKH
jgi:hypothetical protein